MTFLKVKDLQVEFRVDKKMIRPIEGVSFQMQKGEVLGMVGEIYKLMLYVDGFGAALFAILAVDKVWNLGFGLPEHTSA